MFANASSVSSTVTASSASDRADPAGRDRNRQRRRIGDVTGEEEDRAQQPEPDARHEVPAARAQERAGARAAEAGVVGGEWDPRDGDRDDQVDALRARTTRPRRLGPRGRRARRRRAPTRSGRAARRAPPRPRTCGRTCRTKSIGPSSASASAIPPKSSVHSHCARNPSTSSESAATAVAMIRSSKIDQPTHCAALITVGPQEPRRPSGARIRTIAGTRASAPISPATPSIAFPIRLPSDDRDDGLGQRERRHEVRPRHEHEQRDAEVAPEESVVEEPEHAQALGHRFDSPGGRPLHCLSLLPSPA